MEDKKDRLISIVKTSVKPPRKRAKPAQQVRIAGSHNIVGDGNTVIHAKTVRPRTVTPPPPGSITPAQAQTIRELLAEWVATHNRVKQYPLSWAAAWESFKKTFRVNSYLHLPAESYGKACAWLRRKRAIIDTMKSAPRRDPDWRVRAIRYIKARCKNQLGNEHAYLPYIARFGKTSLADLTDDELADTRAYIAHKKNRLTRRPKAVFCRMESAQTLVPIVIAATRHASRVFSMTCRVISRQIPPLPVFLSHGLCLI